MKEAKICQLCEFLTIFFSSTGLQGGHMFFNAVKEGDTVIFASDDEQDRILWVQVALFVVMLRKAHLSSHYRMSGSR